MEKKKEKVVLLKKKLKSARDFDIFDLENFTKAMSDISEAVYHLSIGLTQVCFQVPWSAIKIHFNGNQKPVASLD